MIRYIDPVPKGIQLTERQRQALADQYNRGASIRAISELRGWSYGSAHRQLTIAAASGLLTLRPRGGPRKVTGDQGDRTVR